MSDTKIAPPLDRAAFARDWGVWHDEHELRRADPHGFLAVTGMYWVGERRLTLPDAPGTWWLEDGSVHVELRDDERLEIDGTTIAGRHAFAPIEERGGTTVAFDGGVVEVARRGGRDILRPRRPDHSFLGRYVGTPTYLPNPRWRVPVSWHPFPSPRPVEVGSAVDGLTHVYDAPGELEFVLRGERFRLTAFDGKIADSLLVLFADATSGLTTYPAVRSVVVDASGTDAVIDFNRAVNLPCAYTDFATCPLPPAGNRLPVGIEAGEKTPSERVHGIVTECGIVAADTAGAR